MQSISRMVSPLPSAAAPSARYTVFPSGPLYSIQGMVWRCASECP